MSLVSKGPLFFVAIWSFHLMLYPGQASLSRPFQSLPGHPVGAGGRCSGQGSGTPRPNPCRVVDTPGCLQAPLGVAPGPERGIPPHLEWGLSRSGSEKPLGTQKSTGQHRPCHDSLRLLSSLLCAHTSGGSQAVSQLPLASSSLHQTSRTVLLLSKLTFKIEYESLATWSTNDNYKAHTTALSKWL